MRLSDSPQKDAAAEPLQVGAQFADLVQESLFEVTPDAIIVTDSEGVIRAANLRAEELFGHKREDLIGKAVEVLVPERFRKRHPNHRDKFNERPAVRPMGAGLKLFGLRKDGSEFPVDIQLRPVETTEGRVILAFARDISERRGVEEAQRRADEQFRALVGSLRNHAVYLLDIDGRILSWNPGAEELKGYSAQEVLGQNFSIFFTQEDLDRDKPAELLRLAKETGREEQEGWRVRKDGERFWANFVITAIRNESGAVTGFSKVVRDFTERKKASDAILLQMSAVLLANQDTRLLLGAISASLKDLIPHDCSTLGTVLNEEDFVHLQFLGTKEDGSRIADVKIRLSGSHLSEILRTGSPLVISDLSTNGYNRDSFSHLLGLGMKTACCVPLIHQGTAQGTMLIAKREGQFSNADAQLMMQVGRQVAVAVHNAQQLRRLTDASEQLDLHKRYLEEEINLENQFEDIVGESTGLRQVLQQIETVAPTDATVLIEGETGTGKELLARAIHRLSKRKKSTFVKLNCAAIPSGLIESELFGHEKGAFTGAIQRKVGKMELAHEGTLFLDEIGELPLELQPKLLRALQEREIERLGSNVPILVNVRLVAATNRNLEQMVAEGKFRSDLYYRLKVFPIKSPPLRERASDIPALVRHFVTMHSRRIGKAIESIPENAMRALVQCKWPGNIRELENFVERAVILTRGSQLYVPIGELQSEQEEPDVQSDLLSANERDLIMRVLRETGGQVGGKDGAAARLGLKRTTLNSKMLKLKIHKSDYISS